MYRHPLIRLIAFMLSGLLAVSLAGWQAGPAAADPPAQTEITLNVSPTTAAPGTTILVSAMVQADPQPAGDVRGQLRFSVAASASDLWEYDVEFGPESLTQSGAGIQFDLTTEDLSFLDAGTERIYISARYEPFDDELSVSYADEFSSSESLTLDFVDLTGPVTGPVATTTLVTGPSSATVGTPVTLAASVTPVLAAGTVQFSVDEVSVGDPVEVEDGEASLSYTFASPGVSTVRAVFMPSDPEAYAMDWDSAGRDVTVTGSAPDPTPTTTLVTGPTSATVGTPATLAASVSPTWAEGTVQFSVGGSPVGSPVTVAAGAASMSHTFASAGLLTVRATFAPANPFLYAGSADSAGLAVSVDAVATTTVVTAPTSATIGSPTTLAATVSPVSATGTVQFSVDGSPVGSPVPVAAGAASVEHTFASTGDSTVRATFTPADPGAYAGSADATGLGVSVQTASTTTEVTGPDTAKVGEEATLTAAVLPADVPGKVTFYVNDTEVATVDVDGGAASAPYTFESEGESSVVAFFEPADADTYRSSTSTPRSFGVEPGTTSESEPEWWDAPISSDSGCAKVGPARGEGTVLRRAGPIESFFGGILVQVQSFIWIGLSFIPNVFNELAQYVAMFFQVGPFSGCKTDGGGHRAAAVTTTVQCVLTDAGYWCPVDIPAGSRVSMEGSLPIPAGLAGKLVKFETTMSTVDPTTGELTTVGSGTTRVRVPKRTVLSARLAPAKANLTSVRPGKIVSYRVQVGNKGVVTADGVRTCVSVGKGADVLTAKGAQVHGRRACWTLPSLKKRQTMTRTVTLMAPRTTGPLKIVGTVTPKKSQANPLRLTTVLPVR